MKLYLSSFGVGNRESELRSLAAGRRLGFIPNALDGVEADTREDSNVRSLSQVRELGLEVETFDLRQYFGAVEELRADLAELDGVWVRGGNTFVLRQAMRLSGFDDALRGVATGDFLYGGYSAGVCVLAPSLDGLQPVDDPTVFPYSSTEVVWEGLGVLDYLLLPHFESDHPESADIDRAVGYCMSSDIPFRTMRDGDVIICEHFPPTLHA